VFPLLWNEAPAEQVTFSDFEVSDPYVSPTPLLWLLHFSGISFHYLIYNKMVMVKKKKKAQLT
jgi:hypothetical protein